VDRGRRVGKDRRWERPARELQDRAQVCLGLLQFEEGQNWPRSRGLSRTRASRFTRNLVSDYILVLGIELTRYSSSYCVVGCWKLTLKQGVR